MSNRKSICIIALSPIARDGRVLRQIEYLSPYYDLTIIGYGPMPTTWANAPNIKWMLFTPPARPKRTVELIKHGEAVNLLLRSGAIMRRRMSKLSLYLGQKFPPAYHLDDWFRSSFVRQLVDALAVKHDAYHANDWNTVQFAAEAAQKHKAHFVVDLHEFAPLEFENQPDWWLYEPRIRYMLRKYATKADAVMTVAGVIAERYAKELNLKPMVVLNAPDYAPTPPKQFDPTNIQLTHHGIASKIRKPEVMIETVALADARYTLHFMFVPSPYIDELKQLAAERAPGRVFFHDAVAPEKIVTTIAEYDIGFNFIAPTNYNYLVCLPNKFFESINAGLAICTGPSPAMAEIVQKYGCGVVAPSFEPQDLAAVLNQTTAEQWVAMQQAAREAAKELNATREMDKVVQLYARLFAEK